MTKLIKIFLTSLTLAGCFHEAEVGPAKNDDGSIAYTPLNDTGVTAFLDDAVFLDRALTDPAPSPSLLTSAPASLPGQDASYGRDITDPYAGNGAKGFNFIKLDSEGVPLPDQSVSYDLVPWSCVLDTVTGLMWEVKTPGGLQNRNYTYTWYDPNSETNGGHEGSAAGSSQCSYLSTGAGCNTHEYIQAVNTLNTSSGLCGYTDWRLPTREELRSLIDYGIVRGSGVALIDTNFFPNTNPTDHWTSQTALYRNDGGASAWEVHFEAGYSEGHLKNASQVTVRLVRNN